MRQDKDRGGKWLLTHHGDAVLRLGGLTGFTSYTPLAAETVAPRRLPDGLLEVRFPGQAELTLVLVEIETYPDSDADRQVFDDLMLIAVDRNAVPEVVSLVLKPKGKLNLTGTAERTSRRGRTRLSGSWPVVRLWELDAEELLNSPDAGVVPWVPLTRTTLQPDELLARCRDRLAAVADPNDRAGLIAVTGILAKLAFPNSDLWPLFRSSGVLDKVIEEVKRLNPGWQPLPVFDVLPESPTAQNDFIRALGASSALRDWVGAALGGEVIRTEVRAELNARFGDVPADRIAALDAVSDPARLRALLRLAVTCPDLDAFVAGLSAAP
jgi:hypothetical protein